MRASEDELAAHMLPRITTTRCFLLSGFDKNQMEAKSQSSQGKICHVAFRSMLGRTASYPFASVCVLAPGSLVVAAVEIYSMAVV